VPNLIKVLDDFYPEPDLIREIALRSTYHRPPWAHGYRSTRGFLPRGTLEKIQAAVGFETVRLLPEKYGSTCFYHTLGRGGLREGFYAHIDCEKDPRQLHYNCVAYLSPRAAKRSGTGIYRHKKTGIWQDPTPDDARKLGLSRKRVREWLREESEDPSRWELLDSADNVYNRAVLFPSHWYHSGGGFFGSRVENGRLYQAIFFAGTPYMFDV
jgi:hypothetical protein